MSLLATIYQTGRDIGAALKFQVLLTPNQMVPGGGIWAMDRTLSCFLTDGHKSTKALYRLLAL